MLLVLPYFYRKVCPQIYALFIDGILPVKDKTPFLTRSNITEIHLCFICSLSAAYGSTTKPLYMHMMPFLSRPHPKLRLLESSRFQITGIDILIDEEISTISREKINFENN